MGLLIQNRCNILQSPVRSGQRRVPVFSGTRRNSKVEGYSLTHTTHLFRSPKLFEVLPGILRQHFPQGAPLYCFAASDGSEPFSIAMKLMSQCTPSESNAFFPILASDISPQLMEHASQGVIDLSLREQEMAQTQISGFQGAAPCSFSDFLTAQPRPGWQRFLPRFLRGRDTFQATPRLREAVTFQCRDIVPFSRVPQPQPMVVLFRNAWYHLGQVKSRTLAQDLFKNLAPGSLLVIGETELTGYCQASVQEILVQTGFIPLAQGEGMIFKR